MGWATRAMLGLAGAAAALGVLGFVLFATSVTRELQDEDQRADGIVVLTGGDLRIAEGGRLLHAGRAGRMLISGVNTKTSRHDLLALTGLDEGRFDCCVDLGYGALDTVGNAAETRLWVRQRRFSSLIVVTSRYHMPRGLAELKMEIPDVNLIAHPVTPRHLRPQSWWLHLPTARVLVSEYVKFLPTAARLAASRLMSTLNGSLVAAAPPPLAGRT